MIPKLRNMIKNSTYFLLLLILGVLLCEAPDSDAFGNVVVPGATFGKFRHGTFPSLGNRTHVGVDLVAECGSTIYAFEDGKVIDGIYKSTDIHFNNLGYMVLIEHSVLLEGRKFYTIYLNMQDSPNVVVGNSVIGGKTKIGKVGDTGVGDGCQTHFEIRYFSARFSKWGKLYGLGDKRFSKYFMENWEDPLKYFSTFSYSDTETYGKEIDKEEEKTDKTKKFTKKHSISIHPVQEKSRVDQIFGEHYGLWAEGDCKSPDAFFYITKDLVLIIDKTGAELRHSISVRRTSNFLIQQWKKPYPGEKLQYLYYVQYIPLDNLDKKVLTVFRSQDFTIEQNIDNLHDSPPSNYMSIDYNKCEDMPSDVSFIHAEGVTFMKSFHDISIKCEKDIDNCVNHLFSLVDISKDNKLSKAEISRIIRIMSYIVVVSGKGVAKNDDITSILAIVSLISPSIAGAIIDGSDYDNDGQLSMEEMFYDRNFSSVVRAFEKFSFDVAVSFIAKMFGVLAHVFKILPQA